jgi:glycosyltransferase involved in cell wall biosynthesis
LVAAFNALAALSVNPSLFEGGFPFTFCEAYSVGTPSVTSDIPAVREMVIEPELRRRMLFDPYNINDMSNRILWALDNRCELLRMQADLFAAFPSWETVASRYIDYILEPFP